MRFHDFFIELVELSLHAIVQIFGQLTHRVECHAARLKRWQRSTLDVAVWQELFLFLVVELFIGRGDQADDWYLSLNGQTEGVFLEWQQFVIVVARSFRIDPNS